MSKQVFSVTSLNRYIKHMLDSDMNLSSILVKGELSNFTRHRSGHWYFSLKDAKSKMSCVMFASYANRCQIDLKEGMQIIVSASMTMYEAQGSCQLMVTKIQSDGLGDLYLQLEQRKQRLQQEGLFSLEHKKELPLYPMSIGIVSAKSGAALQDMLSTIARRWPLAKTKLYPTLVQGEQAATQIIAALKQADESGHEVILLARGGGAIEDLWCFNDEALARCIYEMNTVIVSGVGHETDTTLVDYVSDARAPTPTGAAELITPDILEVRNQVRMIQTQLQMDMEFLLQESRNRWNACRQQRYLKEPSLYVKQDRMRLAMLTREIERVSTMTQSYTYQMQHIKTIMSRKANELSFTHRNQLQVLMKEMKQNIQQLCDGSRQNLSRQIALLDAFSPLKILQRGYSISYHNDEIIHSIHAVKKQDSISVRVSDGMISADIKEIKEFSHE